MPDRLRTKLTEVLKMVVAVFNLCKALIQRGRTEGLIDKMDAYLAADRLTVAEYNELIALLEGSGND